jgi:hypothetical protein
VKFIAPVSAFVQTAAAAGMAPCPGWPFARHSEWNCPATVEDMLAFSMMIRDELFPIALIRSSADAMAIRHRPPSA